MRESERNERSCERFRREVVWSGANGASVIVLKWILQFDLKG